MPRARNFLMTNEECAKHAKAEPAGSFAILRQFVPPTIANRISPKSWIGQKTTGSFFENFMTTRSKLC
jgi:hypothetical protein